MFRNLLKFGSRTLAFIALFLLLGWTLSARADDAQPTAAPDQVDQPAAPLSRVLASQLSDEAKPVSFLVILDEQLDVQEALQDSGVAAASPATRGETLYRQLTEVALRTQAPLRAWLDANHIAYTPFYLVNMIEVQGDLHVAETVRRFAGVNRLEANPRVNNSMEVESGKSWLSEFHSPEVSLSPAASEAVPYGLSFTHADQVWALGYRGQGIVVASQDTGVKWDQPALQAAYRGYITATNTVSHTYNWYDAINGANRPGRCDQDATVPCDDDSHGTHTVGTMVGDATEFGDTVLGMAPDAQWIACRNMDNGVGTPATYTTCFEFLMAPYPQGGNKFTQGRTDLAPQVINNSWGCPVSEGCDPTSLRQVVEKVRAAGIMVVASAGNTGSSCSSVSTPIAIHDATFTVGAHNINGDIASFSSRGPVAVDGSLRRKPDISAPGVSVRSAGLDDSYTAIKSGTSMASPHVAGAVALLYSAAPWLIGKPDLTEQVLIKSATPVPNQECPISQVGDSPNNVYGFGRLDVLAAVEIGQHPAGAQIHVQSCDGTPAPNLQLQLTDARTAYVYSQTTDISGTALFSQLIAGPETEAMSLTLSSMISTTQPYQVWVQSGQDVSLTVSAQPCAPLAALTVTVKLQDGSLVIDAPIQIVHQQSHLQYFAKTDAAGQATLANLPDGEYEVTVEQQPLCGNFPASSLILDPGQQRQVSLSATGSCGYYFPFMQND